MKKFIIYYRVSTKRQGESGLGLEAQQRDIGIFLKAYTDSEYQIIEEITDVMSGKGSIEDRPVFKKAVELTQQHNATLLVAKLDRLSRDVETVARLIKLIDIKVACMPHADKFQLHLFSALAEQERDFISARTKAALQSARERGVKLGGARPQSAYQKQQCIKYREQETKPRYEHLRTPLTNMRKQGYNKTECANHLNMMGFTTTQLNRPWDHRTVTKALKYLEIK